MLAVTLLLASLVHGIHSLQIAGQRHDWRCLKLKRCAEAMAVTGEVEEAVTSLAATTLAPRNLDKYRRRSAWALQVSTAVFYVHDQMINLQQIILAEHKRERCV